MSLNLKRTLDYIRFVGITTIKQRKGFIHQTAPEHCRIQNNNGAKDLKTAVEQFLMQLSKSLLLRELEKLKNHCQEMIRRSLLYDAVYSTI